MQKSNPHKNNKQCNADSGTVKIKRGQQNTEKKLTQTAEVFKNEYIKFYKKTLKTRLKNDDKSVTVQLRNYCIKKNVI
jgi:hypothetical protein